MSNLNVFPLYTNVAVNVCKGDITADSSDVIINGVYNPLFDLSASEFLKLLFANDFLLTQVADLNNRRLQNPSRASFNLYSKLK